MKKAKTAKLLQKATEERNLGKMPKELFTMGALLYAGRDGWNTFHYAARHGQLNRIPKELLTEEGLNKRNKANYNTFHVAAIHGSLEQLPKSLLTPKNLLGETVIMWPLRFHMIHSLIIPELNPREWTSHIVELKRIQKMYKRIKLSKFIKEVETIKQIEELPSLKT